MQSHRVVFSRGAKIFRYHLGQFRICIGTGNVIIGDIITSNQSNILHMIIL